MLPQQNIIRKSTTSINTFKGLNRTCNTGFSKVAYNSSSIFTEFKNMYNMTSDKYPQLAPRAERSRLFIENGLNIKSNLLSVNNGFVFLDSEKNLHIGNELTHIEQLTSENHTLVLYGNKIVIFPEKLSVNISDKVITEIDVRNENKECIGSCMFSSSTHACVPSIQKCNYDFNSVNNINIIYTYTSSSEIDSPDLRNTEKIFYKYLSEGDRVEFINIFMNTTSFYLCTNGNTDDENFNLKSSKILSPMNYVKINATGVGIGLKTGDYIYISGLEHSIPQEIAESEISIRYKNDTSYIDVLNNNYFKLYDCGEDYIVIRAEIKNSVPYNGSVNVTRISPELDSSMIIEFGNRLWGCNSEKNEIYCCKLSDETNWQAYLDGISTDSWSSLVGSEGRFTGVTKRTDCVLFFKENFAIKICGTKPSNFCFTEYNIQGVEQGSEKSLINLNNTFFYLGHGGVYAYESGSLPRLISEKAFSDKRYHNAVGGKHRNKYYISAQNENGSYELFVFDTDNNLWHKEDNTEMLDTTTYNGVMYFIDENADSILSPDKKDNILCNYSDYEFQQEDMFEWSFETGDLYDSEFNTKNINRIRIGIKALSKSKVRVYAQYKDNGEYYEIADIRSSEKKPRIFPIIVRRAEYLRLKFLGTGQVEIYGIDIEHSRGSDNRNGF